MFERLRNALRARPVVIASRCASCGEILEQHIQADIGSAVINTEDDTRLRDLIQNHQWSVAVEHHAANATADIRASRVIRCKDGRIGVVARIMPIETWSDDYYEEPFFLSPNDANELLQEVPL